MVKNSIKVFARLKHESSKKTWQYSIKRKQDYEAITFFPGTGTSCNRQEHYNFRNVAFHKVFDQHSSQTDVFETIAKPVVNSALNGYNGTIFAYGQTGSGKTYAITGSSVDYNGRGIIPRSVQHIFQFTNTSPDAFSIHISYLEIYKEVGYDLLNPKHKACRLEELPRVLLLEDAKGDAHLRNLNVLPVSTEQEAMRLLFLGDTNRTIAETPMNEYSSRSHCIFTVHITAKNSQSGKIRRSKLHLVDLAGSERVHKTRITGSTLSEAKQINLSLHYLEQVILALSQSKRSHVPYRNSMMTYMLRDSLSGNCLTVMLATVAVNERNILETVSTCRFAQRVALMSTEAKINEEVDPHQEISMLRDEVQELRKQLALLKGIPVTEPLSKDQEKHCKSAVKKFLNDNTTELYIDSDLRQVQLCFQLLKKAVFNQMNEKENIHNESLAKMKETVRKKDEEIAQLKQRLEPPKPITTTTPSSDYSANVPSIDLNERQNFGVFISDPQNLHDINYFNCKLQQKYESAKRFAETVERCQNNIKEVRQQLQNPEVDQAMQARLNSHLMSQQTIYREALLQLENVKKETDHLKHGLEQAQIRLMRRFQTWKTKGVENQSVSRRVLGASQELVPLILSNREQFGLEFGDNYLTQPRNTPIEHSATTPSSFKNIPEDYSPCLDVVSQSAKSDQSTQKGSGDGTKSTSVLEEDSSSIKSSPNKSLFKETDNATFRDFMKTVPLTGDEEVDEEIFNFYRSKFNL